MANTIFTLEALDAAFGDCLLLHYGPVDKPRLIVIDGGPKDIFKRSLSPRLKEILAASGGASLEVRMLMVSHIDGDHITGVLDLARELRRLQDDNEQLPYDILTLWHNSFDDIVAKLGAQPQALLRTLKSKKNSDAAAIIATVPQGRTLRIDANALSLNLNSGFDDLVSFRGKKESTIDLGGGLSFLVLGPRQAELDALEEKWATEVEALLEKQRTAKTKKKGVKAGITESDEATVPDASMVSPAALEALAASFADRSVANLSSLVVLASHGGKTMLLTGDANGRFILDSLRECGLLPKSDGNFHVDVLKMPHHGSDRNVTKGFLQQVTADHYLFSADGTNGNPDVATFRMLFDARPNGGYALWLTNDVTVSTKFVKANRPPGVELNVRKKTQHSLRLELAKGIAF